MTDGAQRRNFSRVRFLGGARLSVGDGEYDCEVLDLSLKGALARPADAVPARPGEPCLLELRLGAEDAVVRMDGTIAHMEAGRLGVVWHEIDLDSMVHLRRLLELNLGDPRLLDRELSALLAG